MAETIFSRLAPLCGCRLTCSLFVQAKIKVYILNLARSARLGRAGGHRRARFFREQKLRLFSSKIGVNFRALLLSSAMPHQHGRPNRPKRPPPRAQARNPDKTGERIAKVMARVGLCSRRDAEAWIAEGRVSVNG